MKARIVVQDVSTDTASKAIYEQEFPDLDLPKLVAFLNQKRRVRKAKKEAKGE